nr:hypothetical protein Iba_chr14fCG8250 [Ipomoea batatas]
MPRPVSISVVDDPSSSEFLLLMRRSGYGGRIKARFEKSKTEEKKLKMLTLGILLMNRCMKPGFARKL